MQAIMDRIGKKLGIPGIAGLLSERLSGTELNSLLLEVFEERMGRVGPAGLLQQYKANRMVQPSGVDMIRLLEIELGVLCHLRGVGFLAVELSPAAQLGSCSVVATASQKKIISAVRNTEIVADATNALALHIAGIRSEERKRGEAAEERKMCTVHRHIRTQEMKGKGFTPHFKVGCMVTAGRDTGNYVFECVALTEYMRVLHGMFRSVFGVEEVRFVLQRRAGYDERNPLIDRVFAYAAGVLEGIEIMREEPAVANSYYKGIQFKMIIRVRARDWEIADGGFVDWTQQLLGDSKERMLIGGFGLELLYKLLYKGL